MIIVDYGHLSKRSLYANREAIVANYNFYIHTTLNMILNIVEKFGVSKQNPIILAIDSSSWRKDFYDNNKPNIPEYENQTYKGKRVKDNTLDWESITKMDSDIIDTLKKYSDFHVLKLDKCEADDIIAVISKHTKEQCIIISSDKDFQQLKTDNVSIYDPIKLLFIEPLNIERFKKLHYMIGDKIDNILAIQPRLGEKTAEKIYNKLDEMLSLNPEMKLRYEFNKQLIDFDCIPEEIQKNILTEYEKNDIMSYNNKEMIKFFMKYNLSAIAERQHLFKYKDSIIENTYLKSSKETINTFFQNTLDDFFKD